jgi:hypothetical protein
MRVGCLTATATPILSRGPRAPVDGLGGSSLFRGDRLAPFGLFCRRWTGDANRTACKTCQDFKDRVEPDHHAIKCRVKTS